MYTANKKVKLTICHSVPIVTSKYSKSFLVSDFIELIEKGVDSLLKKGFKEHEIEFEINAENDCYDRYSDCESTVNAFLRGMRQETYEEFKQRDLDEKLKIENQKLAKAAREKKRRQAIVEKEKEEYERLKMKFERKS